MAAYVLSSQKKKNMYCCFQVVLIIGSSRIISHLISQKRERGKNKQGTAVSSSSSHQNRKLYIKGQESKSYSLKKKGEKIRL